MPTVQALVQHKEGVRSALLSTLPDLKATQQLASMPAGSKHVQNGKLAEEDSESTDAGSSDSETDLGFSSSASCSDAGSDFDSTTKSGLLGQVHRRPRPAPARRLRLQGCAGFVFRGTPLPTIPATPASKTSTWGAAGPASSEDEDSDRETSGEREDREDALCVIKHSALSSAADRVGAAENLSPPPGLPTASMPMFRPPPGLPPPPPPGLQLARLPESSTPTTLPICSPILSTVPPQRFAPFEVPQQKFTSSTVPPSHKAPIMFEAELHKTPPDWCASSPAVSKSMDVKSFLPPMQAGRVQLMLSTQGIRNSCALAAR
eukprot:TRINITY_DN102015_c0_g1_i1.p1 TRINITY_DN102015_c0_g1~~TRINITY_DN102015_c0_g1_i1.p1  ORF type:complete len:319 (-),score=67.98 TRINITY_DN102015_c0_g1_i1:397-1353(-)